MSTHHTVSCRPEHCHWGFFDSALPPVVTVASGDTVTLDCVSGGRDILPSDPGFEILADHRAIHEAVTPRLGAHILTGPVAVEGATPGDVLQIDILSIEPRQNWGYTRIRPLVGTLPEDFPITKTVAQRHRPPARGRDAADRHRDRTGAVFRRHGGRAAAGLWRVQLDPAARIRRQHGPEGAGRRHDSVPAGLGAGRAVLGRRRARRAG